MYLTLSDVVAFYHLSLFMHSLTIILISSRFTRARGIPERRERVKYLECFLMVFYYYEQFLTTSFLTLAQLRISSISPMPYTYD